MSGNAGSASASSDIRVSCHLNIHRDMAALPICRRKLSGCRPLASAYPKELLRIGDHVRKRRLDLKLLQKDIGQQLGVHCASVTNWELGKTDPELCHMPAVIQFLGYDPRPKTEPQTLAEKIVVYRVQRGLSQKRFSKMLGVDVTTLARWERGERVPGGVYAQKVNGVLGETSRD